MIRIFAVVTRGLEDVAAAELSALPGVRVEGIGYRRVAGQCAGPIAPLLDLRTVDDLFLDQGAWSGIGPERAALSVLRAVAARLDLYQAAAVCEELRNIHQPPAFSVTANFVGKRNYTSDEIKLACAGGIEESHHGWAYTPDDREADLNLRVFIEHEKVYVGVRLAKKPLQNRAYKREHVPGSLRPPVAAAMARLAGVTESLRILDPCCGAGTLLVEGAHWGASAYGGDADPAAIAAARSNGQNAGASSVLCRWDARAIPLADGAVDRVITNPPWGRKVEITDETGEFYGEIGREIARVLAPTGRAVVLTWVPDCVKAWSLVCRREIEISLYGRKPTILVLSKTQG